MIVNGRVVLDSEIWINALTPERAAELERDFQAKRSAERIRVDARFGTEVRNKQYQPEFRFVRHPKSTGLKSFEQRCDRLVAAMEQQAAARARRNRLLDAVLD